MERNKAISTDKKGPNKVGFSEGGTKELFGPGSIGTILSTYGTASFPYAVPLGGLSEDMGIDDAKKEIFMNFISQEMFPQNQNENLDFVGGLTNSYSGLGDNNEETFEQQNVSPKTDSPKAIRESKEAQKFDRKEKIKELEKIKNETNQINETNRINQTNETNRTNETNQTNQTNETNEIFERYPILNSILQSTSENDDINFIDQVGATPTLPSIERSPDQTIENQTTTNTIPPQSNKIFEKIIENSFKNENSNLINNITNKLFNISNTSNTSNNTNFLSQIKRIKQGDEIRNIFKNLDITNISGDEIQNNLAGGFSTFIAETGQEQSQEVLQRERKSNLNENNDTISPNGIHLESNIKVKDQKNDFVKSALTSGNLDRIKEAFKISEDQSDLSQNSFAGSLAGSLTNNSNDRIKFDDEKELGEAQDLKIEYEVENLTEKNINENKTENLTENNITVSEGEKRIEEAVKSGVPRQIAEIIEEENKKKITSKSMMKVKENNDYLDIYNSVLDSHPELESANISNVSNDKILEIMRDEMSQGFNDFERFFDNVLGE